MNIYYKGNAIDVDGGKTSNFNPWAVSDSTSPTDMETLRNYTSDQFVTNVYDSLMALYPTYITKSIIGKDSTDTYNIYQYIFCPDYPEQTIYLQAGVHGNEYDGWIGLGNLMKLICNHWTEHEWLAYLRWKCRIIVVPIVNVWSVSQPTRVRRNANNVDLNRDMVSLSQTESQVMKANIDSLDTLYDLSFALDFHTTTDSNWGGDAAIGDNINSVNHDITALVAKSMAKKYSHDRLTSYVSAHNLEADGLYLPFFFNSASVGTYSSYFRSLGLVGVTIEHSDYVYSQTVGNNDTGRIALDVFANHVIMLSMQKYAVN